MDVSAVVLVIAQWVHTLAAAFWVGGGLVYLLVIRPAARQAGGGGQTLADEFRSMVDIAVITMVISGVVLTFDRLTLQHAGVGYAATLGAKLALTLWMFWLAGVIRRRPRPSARRQATAAASSGWRRFMDASNQVVAIGVVVFLLSTVMQSLFEHALR